MWASVCSLKFEEVNPNHNNTKSDGSVENEQLPIPIDIDILFVRGKHGDGLPFDGPEGIVAHAFYPTAGALHFDADENWTLNQSGGINLFQVELYYCGYRRRRLTI
jgi:hypothetical protein